MTGKKRSSNGQVKPHPQPKSPAQDVPMTDAIPPCGQPQPPSSKTASTPNTTRNPQKAVKKPQEPRNLEDKPLLTSHATKPHNQRKKLPKLPNNTLITKRPLLHPSIPTPFSSAHFPKTLYITASTPYIPCLKRVRKLLAQIVKREAQSVAALGKKHGARGGGVLEVNGRLEARDVERAVVGEVQGSRRGGGGSGGGGNGDGGEEVHLKATGRAISRALEIGVYFQGQGDCRVRVDMGSVSAVDDIEVVDAKGQSGGGDAAVQGEGEGGDGSHDVPETRIRTLSCVTVSIGLK
ncbi:ribonuclease p mrp subunit pop7 protein [Stemphylium lycopersici]|nr:ribonuclease p mrp subunit pop7 protein [Stemphylium lycopersici]